MYRWEIRSLELCEDDLGHFQLFNHLAHSVQVESLLKIHPLVENICVYGDPSRIHTVAILVPDQAMLLEMASKVKLRS